MYKLLLLLLIPISLLGQSNKRRVGEYYGIGKPTFNANGVNDLSIDTKASQVWEYFTSSSTVSTANRWRLVSDTSITNTYFSKGQKGDQGIQGVQGERGQQGVPGVQGVQGIQGMQGAPGQCPSCPPSSGGVFPFNIVINNGTDNRTQVQAAIDETYISGKPIFLIGKDFKMSGGVKIPKDIKFLSIDGGAELTATNGNTWTFFYSDVPVNVTEAEGVYTNRRMIFQNIKLNGVNQAQTGFDLMASEGAIFNHIEGHTLKLLIDNVFGLRSDINNCEVINCLDGIKVTSAYLKYSGATIENAAPNGTTIRNFRAVGSSNSNVALRIADCSECLVENIVIEGHKWNIGIDWDCVSPTSTPANIDRIHWEAANAAGVAVIRIKSSTMTHVINNPNMIKPSMMVEVVVASGGFPNVKFTNVSNQRVYFDDVNPILKSAVGVGWKFENCDHPFVAYKMPKIFTGASMSNSCIRENGVSRWCIESPPN